MWHNNEQKRSGMALYNTNSQDDFTEKVEKSSKLVLVDFWAEWCPPCRAMAPILHDIAESEDVTLDVVKVNIEESADNAALAQKYGVQGIPNMQIFKAGAHVDNIIGMVPASVLKATLQKYM
jgi:thioredoxin 1